MRDVRMKGFAERADVEEVWDFLRGQIRPLPSEAVDILSCVGRVLAEDVRAEVDVPGFARSAMDGYAVCGEDTFGASTYDTIALDVRGEALPGVPFAGVCEERGGKVEISEAVAPHKNVGAIGEDIRVDDLVLRAGRRLRPQDAGLLASIGVRAPRCVRRPLVQLVVTGDELLPAGRRPEGVCIVDSNSVVLRSLVTRDGGELLPFEILPDRPEIIREALRSPDADMVIVSGGSSVGTEDHAPRLVAELGSLDFHGISMRPSSPTGIGRIEGRPVFLLPGNPVSCLCAYEFFAGPNLRALGGRSREWPHRRARLPLARKISSAVGRTDYVRIAVESEKAIPIGTSGASILSSTVRADGCVIVPRELEGMAEGAEVEVLLYDDEIPEEVAP
jgi:molybdopterin molybdotransferase